MKYSPPVDLNELNRIVTALEEIPDEEKVDDVSVALCGKRYISKGEKLESEELTRRLAGPVAKRFSIDVERNLEGRLVGRDGGPSSIAQRLAFVLTPEDEIDSTDIDSQRKWIDYGVDYQNLDESMRESPEDKKSEIEHTISVNTGYAEKMVDVYGLPMEMENRDHDQVVSWDRTLKYREFFDKTLEDL